MKYQAHYRTFGERVVRGYNPLNKGGIWNGFDILGVTGIWQFKEKYFLKDFFYGKLVYLSSHLK